ncbi:MAG: molybdenum cofactor guanylyltransferase [Chloroflexota bacterium]|nr:MAG: molybdenum cofactor guanylyltransferase [Chloroflexota bacterium]
MTGPPPLDDVVGIVLAGGRSTRFGADKLAVEVDGRPLLHHAIEAVAAVVSQVIVVASPGTDPALPADLEARVRVVHDPQSFGGPLVGLVAALGEADAPIALVVGGDMPRMVPLVLRRLVATIGPGRPAVSLEIPGRIHPLPMALDVLVAGRAAATVLERGGRALRELLAEVGAISIPAPVWLALDPAGATIVDIDRPTDLGSAEPT